jgi:hypothetical protein
MVVEEETKSEGLNPSIHCYPGPEQADHVRPGIRDPFTGGGGSGVSSFSEKKKNLTTNSKWRNLYSG